MNNLPELIRTERTALIDLLETLSPDEWATPSLCGEWSVREVAAHLAWAPASPVSELLTELVRQGIRINRANAALASRWARRDTAQIVEQLRANAASGARPTGMPMPAALADAVVHAIDIRRPLNKPRSISPKVFEHTAVFFIGLGGPLTTLVGGSARKRVADLRLVADDVNWSYGAGPEVHGSAEALTLLLSGRAVEPGELTGPGADELRRRLGSH